MEALSNMVRAKVRMRLDRSVQGGIQSDILFHIRHILQCEYNVHTIICQHSIGLVQSSLDSASPLLV
jgi:hypothetical protein